MKETTIDKLISWVSPSAGNKRMRARMVEDRIRSAQREYEAAKYSRYNKDWHPSLRQSPNIAIQQALSILRAKSRDLADNDDLCRNVVRVICNNVIGTGIMPNFSASGSSSKTLEKKVKDIWKGWAEKLTCDVSGRCTFYSLQRLAMRLVVVDGECLIVRRWQRGNADVPLKLQILSGEYIDTTKYEQLTQDGGCILFGIEFNKDGSRKGYWLYERNPMEFYSVSSFYKADDVIHLFEMERDGQFRGLPFSKSSMIAAKDLSDYQFAEKIRAKVAASFSAFVTNTSSDVDAISSDEFDTIEPNSIVRLRPGEEVKFSTPPLTTGYAEFVRNGQRGVSIGSGVTYESASGDYGNVNFSSGRMGWIEMSRNIQALQWDIIIPHLCDRVFGWFVEAIQLKGVIPVTKTISVTWTAPRREMINPLQETNARAAALKSGLISRQEILREDGYNPEEINEELVEDADFQKNNGLNFGVFEEIQLQGKFPEEDTSPTPPKQAQKNK